MKGIIYVRVSSEEQVHGTSLVFQEEICVKYCADHRIDVLEIFQEQGVSAKTAKRPQLVRALEFCRKNKNGVQAFIVAKVDRFARNTEDHFAVRGMLKRYGTALHSVTEPIGNSPTERLLETVLAGSAEFDNAIRTQRSTDGLKAQLKRGIWPWKVPLGYLNAGTKRQGLKKFVPDSIDPSRYHQIQHALQTYASGSMQSLTQFAEYLNTLGVQSAQQKRITVQLADRMLDRHLPFYAGNFVDPFTGDELPGRHTPMITQDERHRIRLIRSGKYRHMKRRDRNTLAFPLRRTILCATCTRPLTASAPRGRTRRYRYYHCASKMCGLYGKSFPQKRVEEEFVAAVSRIRPRFGALASIVKVIVEYSTRERSNVFVSKKGVEDRLRTLTAQRARVFEMREDGSYTKEQFLERQRVIEGQTDTLRSELDTFTQDRTADIGTLVNAGLTFIRDLTANWALLSSPLKRRFQRVIFPQGICYNPTTGFGTAVLGSLFERFAQIVVASSANVPPP